MMAKIKTMAKGNAVDIAGAEKKLRQAEFFLWHLEHEPKEIAKQLGNLRGGGDPETLEFWFSACLSAAQSAFYVLDKTGGQDFKRIERDWRMGLATDSERFCFNWSVGLRDDDVHYGTTAAEPLPKYIEDDSWKHSPHSYYSRNPLLFGPQQDVEMENPDGTKVSASILRGTVGLYLDQGGVRIEATTACRRFIDQLRSLLDAVKAADIPKAKARER